ncbi:MAG: hypothetical protein Q8O59_03255 [bacterium]|nr:hypothetical protein [bacterium]MDZ4245343.1 hypothetical protein [Candidatus Gracilibacteria bacterium]
MTFRILIGLIGIPLGFLLLKYRERVKDWTGNIGWAEQYLGTGGTWSALILIGILTIVLSFMFMVGSLQTMFFGAFGRFF